MERIKNNIQIVKFSLYGFLKNLKFFEPYLYYYLLLSNINYFQIGILYAVKEAVIYLFEIPSGVLADVYGKKLELSLCFIFYIISFVFFYIGGSFYIYIIAMILFGLGEAFRSGTHKAMIMTYLDKHEIADSKTKIYGLTRSYSLIGSCISALFAVYLVLNLPNVSLLFLIAIIPYILDLILILTYPNYLSEKDKDSCEKLTFIQCNIQNVKQTFASKEILPILFNSSLYASIFKIIKDYIQLIILGATMYIAILADFNDDQKEKIILGVVYAIIYLISAIASRNAYKINKTLGSKSIIFLSWILFGSGIILIGVFTNNIIVVSMLFLLLYIIFNIRKPIIVQSIGDNTDKNKRATTLSIDSQLTSIFVIILAPLLGLVADNYSIKIAFISLGLLIILVFIIRYIFKFNKQNQTIY